MKTPEHPLKHITATITTKKQHIICFIYSDDTKQNAIDFVRDIARLHDNTKEYTVSVKMYLDFNTLYDRADIITDDILTVITFVSMHVNQFIRG